MKRRVVVTGIGGVTPLGNNIKTTWENIKKGQSGIGKLTLRDSSLFPVKVAAEVKGFDPTSFLDSKEARNMDRFTQFAVIAALEAIQDSNLIINEENAHRVGTWVGSGMGGLGTYEEQFKIFMEKGTRRVSPFLIPKMIPDMAAGQVSIFTGAKGPNGCTVTACASGSNSIGEAFKFIQRGDADAMITGGTEAGITDLSLAGFCSAKALSFNEDPTLASRPFDKNRDGFVMGEGAGILILEELGHALKRGSKIYAEIVGYGTTGDAYHITSPSPEGEGGARAMKMALQDAEIEDVSLIDYINAHGTSTELNDKFETGAIKKVFGNHAYQLAVSSTKSMTGHLLGAAGAVEAIFSVKAIQEGIIPPTINYETPDEACDLDYVPNAARTKSLTMVMSNSLGFGGHNASLVFKKY